MAKIIKNIAVEFRWTGDNYALKGFNVAITPTNLNPNTNAICMNFLDYRNSNYNGSTISYTFQNLTLDSSTTYVAWVQACYNDKDSDWTSLTSGTVTDDGTATIETTKSNIANNWKHASDITKIDGGDIYTGSITCDKIYGSTLTLGGINNANGIFKLKDSANTKDIIAMDNTGITIDGGYYKIKEGNVTNDIQDLLNFIPDSSFENVMLNEELIGDNFSTTLKSFTIPIVGTDSELKLSYARNGSTLGGARMLCRSSSLVGFAGQQYGNAKYGQNSIIVKLGNYIEYPFIKVPDMTKQYTFSVWTKRYNPLSPTGVSGLKVTITSINGASCSTPVTTILGLPSDNNEAWVRHTYTFTPPTVAGGDCVRIKIEGTTANWIIIDGVQLVEGALPTIYRESNDLTKGTIQASKIYGGTLAIGGSGNTCGNIVVRDEKNMNIVGLDKNGVTAYDGKITVVNDHLSWNGDEFYPTGYQASSSIGCYGIQGNYINGSTTAWSRYKLHSDCLELSQNGGNMINHNFKVEIGDTQSEQDDGYSIMKFTALKLKASGKSSADSTVLGIDSNGCATLFGETRFVSEGLTYADPWPSTKCAIKVSGGMGIGGQLYANGGVLLPAGDGARSIKAGDNNSISLKSHGDHTWFRNEKGLWTFQAGTSGDDWTQSWQIYLDGGSWVQLGQRQSNTGGYKYQGVQFVRYQSTGVDYADVIAKRYYMNGCNDWIGTGNGDAATWDVCNMDIATWNGFGIKGMAGNVFGDGARTVVFDARNGIVHARGGFSGIGRRPAYSWYGGIGSNNNVSLRHSLGWNPICDCDGSCGNLQLTHWNRTDDGNVIVVQNYSNGANGWTGNVKLY